jgi:epoxyqueuosine reductase QueG
MVTLRDGPNSRYAAEYSAANSRIDAIGEKLAAEIGDKGHRVRPLAASSRTDVVGICGDFPHKTAATLAGLGWIGRHCQLVTFKFGPWVRLGTVFTDMDLPCGPPMERNFCGTCTRCVEACPADALSGAAWHPGTLREKILDVRACDGWKKEHFYQFHRGHNCGICSAACPFGLKSMRRSLRGEAPP